MQLPLQDTREKKKKASGKKEEMKLEDTAVVHTVELLHISLYS